MAYATNPKKNKSARRQRPQVPPSNTIRYKGWVSRDARHNKYVRGPDGKMIDLSKLKQPEVKIEQEEKATVTAEVSAEFKKDADHVFTKQADLMEKLAAA